MTDGATASNHTASGGSADSEDRVENRPLPDTPIEWLAKHLPRFAPMAIDRLAAVADPAATKRVAEYDKLEARFDGTFGDTETPGPDILTTPQYKWFLSVLKERLVLG